MKRQRYPNLKSSSLCWFLFLFVLSMPSFAGGVTVRVPGTDIIGELSVDEYEIYIGRGFRRGAYIETTFLRTSGNDSIKGKNLRWLQLVSTNDPSWTNDAGQFDHVIDPQPDDDPLYYEPFYWTRSELLFFRSDSELEFVDAPFTTWDRRSEVDWQFELYLARQQDQSIQILAKIIWGYHIDTSGLVSLHDARVSTVSRPSEALDQALEEQFPGWDFIESSNGDAEPGGGGGGGGCFIEAVANSPWQ